MHIIIKNKYLLFQNYKVKCSIGKRGIGIKRKEGDLITPKGTFKIKQILYRADRINLKKTKIKKKIINRKLGWCDDQNSKNYNKLIQYPFKFSSEKLYRSDNIYDIILVLNFNMNPIKKRKGSAIFIHVAKKNFSSTKGCVGIKKTFLKKITELIDKKTLVQII
tara:strand:- start:221 stop:712 length:492 start_codon:yes stop_codon:yes gene_type:complete